MGKAPRTPKGVQDATTNFDTIHNWWGLSPFANVAVALAPDYLMLDPDSDEARHECYRLGVPDTLTRFSRNKAFIYRSPEDLGNVKLIHKGESRAIDVLNGYAVVFGQHRTGCRVFLENPTVPPVPAPEWMIQWIESQRQTASSKIDPVWSDDPPVRLIASGLDWWHGQRTVTGPDGEIDRSATLFRIGLCLAEANASPGTIAEALAERDIALCFEKYSGRKDATQRYSDIAQKSVDSKQTQRPGGPSHFRPLPPVQVTVLP